WLVSWWTPNTYPTGGVRRGTATQVPRDPGQPPLLPADDIPRVESPNPAVLEVKLKVDCTDVEPESAPSGLAALVGDGS
ncbi:MAG: hypothetical protein ACYDDU_13045, partial [Dermatophilaceae bacterium]